MGRMAIAHCYRYSNPMNFMGGARSTNQESVLKKGIVLAVVFMLLFTSAAFAGPGRYDFVMIGPSLPYGVPGNNVEVWHPSANYEGPTLFTAADCYDNGINVAIIKDGLLWKDIEIPDLNPGERVTLNGYAWVGRYFTGTETIMKASFFNAHCPNESARLAWFTPDDVLIRKGWISEATDDAFEATLPRYGTGFEKVPLYAARFTLDIYSAEPVPEPGSMATMLGGLIGLGGLALRRRK